MISAAIDDHRLWMGTGIASPFGRCDLSGAMAALNVTIKAAVLLYLRTVKHRLRSFHGLPFRKAQKAVAEDGRVEILAYHTAFKDASAARSEAKLCDPVNIRPSWRFIHKRMGRKVADLTGIVNVIF